MSPITVPCAPEPRDPDRPRAGRLSGRHRPRQRPGVIGAALVASDGTYRRRQLLRSARNHALNHQHVLGLVQTAGGTVAADLREADRRRSWSPLLDALCPHVGLRASSTRSAANGALAGHSPDRTRRRPPEPTTGSAEALQWDMAMIHAPQARAVRGPTGSPGGRPRDPDSVPRRLPEERREQRRLALGHDSLAVLPPGVAVGTPDP